ncbi:MULTISPECIES: hypothetical protein [unclassified Streptomyces]|uniref:hypothetical protein n=1 Tax=unclassified Streptomyces TaxID=2593676 RepID=UPI0004BDE887|nr:MULTISPECIES: hypothetical protein [unclassified Streptomyces]
MDHRLVMAIADAVPAPPRSASSAPRRNSARAEKTAPGWSADRLRGVLGDDIRAVLMPGADWPAMARGLVGLQRGGVDLTAILPRMGCMTARVHQAVVANAARTRA